MGLKNLRILITPPRMFSWKFSAWTVQKQPSAAIHFQMFFQKIPLVESFFWSNYRLAVQSRDYILKWLHQEYFLWNSPKDFGAPKYHRSRFVLSSKGDILRMPNICLHKANLSLNHIFVQLVPRKSFSV